MDTATWIAIYLPLLLVLFLAMQAGRQRLIAKRRRKRSERPMTNELLKSYVGCRCIVSTGSFGSTVTGTVSAVSDNWIEVTTKQGARLLNADYVTNITRLPEKQVRP